MRLVCVADCAPIVNRTLRHCQGEVTPDPTALRNVSGVTIPYTVDRGAAWVCGLPHKTVMQSWWILQRTQGHWQLSNVVTRL